MEFAEEKYDEMIEKLFMRFPSFQKTGASAYKPGIANMEFMDQMMGHPHRSYRVIHVAGTNGKGSVSNMLASALAACGLKVGLYTSPHILDFRERIRCVLASSVRLVSKEYVWDFIERWRDTFDHLDLSFFEITTIMALQWFADENVDVVVLETGLGGRLDSTNIVTPILSIITNIGLDHCDMLGETLPEIAFEKAGIIKPRVPVVIGETHQETAPVFERKVLYTNLPEPSFAGNRKSIMSLLTFADQTEPPLWAEHEEILFHMDLQGAYQKNNLRTVLTALAVLGKIAGQAGNDVTCMYSNDVTCMYDNDVTCMYGNDVTCMYGNDVTCMCCDDMACGGRPDRAFIIRDALINTSRRTGFRGRWEKLSDRPLTICDIGHNEHGLRHNFAQLESMLSEGKCTDLIIVYGSVADKDVDAVLHLMPRNATYVFTQAQSKRALPAEKIYEKFAASGHAAANVYVIPHVADAVAKAKEIAESLGSHPLIYIGGSTYVVSEAVTLK